MLRLNFGLKPIFGFKPRFYTLVSTKDKVTQCHYQLRQTATINHTTGHEQSMGNTWEKCYDLLLTGSSEFSMHEDMPNCSRYNFNLQPIIYLYILKLMSHVLSFSYTKTHERETCIQVAHTTIRVYCMKNMADDGETMHKQLLTKYCKLHQHGPLTNSNAAFQSCDCQVLIQDRTMF